MATESESLLTLTFCWQHPSMRDPRGAQNGAELFLIWHIGLCMLACSHE